MNTAQATGFQIAEIYLRQFDLTAPSQGLKNEVRFNVDNFVTYPYQAFSEYTTSIAVPQVVGAAGGVALSGVGANEVNIQNIINADLTEMIVMFIRDVDNYFHLNPVLPYGVANIYRRQCSLLGVPVRDLELRLNGQTIVLYPGSAYEGFNQPLFWGQERLIIESNNVIGPAGTATAAALRAARRGVVSFVYKMILAQENPLLMEGKEMFNVPRT